MPGWFCVAGETLKYSLQAMPWQFHHNPITSREVGTEMCFFHSWQGNTNPSKAFFERAPVIAVGLLQLRMCWPS